MTGTLYYVATPIGNPDDLSIRARDVLSEAAFIAAEDPQRTERLLRHHGIHATLTSYHNCNKEEKAPIIVKRLQEGNDVCLVCDGGTPAVVDPGAFLLRAAIAGGCRVVPVPGPSAVTAALSIAGLPGDAFLFLGSFPTSRRAQAEWIRTVARERRTIVMFVHGRCAIPLFRGLAQHAGGREIVVAANISCRDEHILHCRAEALPSVVKRLANAEMTVVVQGRATRSKTGTKSGGRASRQRSSRPLSGS